jgi:intracellular sulfur oxidation DsrE/DsrF family protein
VVRNQSPADIARTLQRSLLRGVMLVPSGVAAVALQSRYHYAYLTEQ